MRPLENLHESGDCYYIPENSCCTIWYHHFLNLIPSVRKKQLYENGTLLMIRCDWIDDDYDLSRASSVSLGEGIALSVYDSKAELIEPFMRSRKLTLTEVRSVSCGLSHAFLLTNDHRLYSIGSNRSGQLGINSEVSAGDDPFCIMENVQLVSAGSISGLVKTLHGEIVSFGNNHDGRLGLPCCSVINQPTVAVKGFDRVTCISAGYGHSAFVSDGVLYACGSNSHGQLDFISEELKVEGFRAVNFPLPVTWVGCGTWNTLIISAGGLLFSCGRVPPFQSGPITISDLLEEEAQREAVPPKQERCVPWIEIPTNLELLDVRVGSSMAIARTTDKKALAIIDLVELKCVEVIYRKSEIQDFSISGTCWVIV